MKTTERIESVNIADGLITKGILYARNTETNRLRKVGAVAAIFIRTSTKPRITKIAPPDHPGMKVGEGHIGQNLDLTKKDQKS